MDNIKIKEFFSINEHSSIKATLGKNLYFDPFRIVTESHDADFIFLTHDHFDHYSPEDIEKVRKKDTFFVFPESMISIVDKLRLNPEHYLYFCAGDKRTLFDVEIEAVPAYNLSKPFHPKRYGWLGYVVSYADQKFYVCGDTDLTPEAEQVDCDILFCPVGGTYTMNVEEAASLAEKIQPKVAIPTHYGSVAGTPDDGNRFCGLLAGKVKTVNLLHE